MAERRVLLALALVATALGCRGPGTDRRGTDQRGTTRPDSDQRDSAQRQAPPAADSTPAPAPAPGVAVGPAHVLTLVLTDSSISGPESVPLGVVEIRLVNAGRGIHEARLLRLPARATPQEAIGFIEQRSQLPPGLGPQGGAGPVMPGKTIRVTQMLQAGSYLVVSRLNDGHGRPWFLQGVLAPLVVTGQPRLLQPPNITSQSAAVTSERQWRIGGTLQTSPGRTLLIEGRQRTTELRAGDHVMQLDNFGGGDHDYVLIKADEPRAMREYSGWLEGSGPAPSNVIGGVPALFNGLRAFIHLKLAAGSYIMFCPNYHQNTGVRGFELGEFAMFVAH